jgi:hypothetical protein
MSASRFFRGSFFLCLIGLVFSAIVLAFVYKEFGPPSEMGENICNDSSDESVFRPITFGRSFGWGLAIFMDPDVAMGVDARKLYLSESLSVEQHSLLRVNADKVVRLAVVETQDSLSTYFCINSNGPYFGIEASFARENNFPWAQWSVVAWPSQTREEK